MVLGVTKRVEGHKFIGHDTSAAIHQAVLLQGVIFQRVGKVDTIGIHQLATFQTVQHILGIILLIALLIRFLDATT